MTTPIGHFRPLCPSHRCAMVVTPHMRQISTKNADATDTYYCECRIHGCLQNYSAGFGYFIVARNDDYWVGTRSSSLEINRSATQAICGEHKDAMFLESLDESTNAANFRCPREGCAQTIQIPADTSPAYWLGSGFFRAA